MPSKLFYWGAAVACAFLSSCVADEEVAGVDIPADKATFAACRLNVSMPESRFAAADTAAYELFYSVYHAGNGKLLASNVSAGGEIFKNDDTADILDVNLPYTEGDRYNLAVWASRPGQVTVDEGLRNIVFDYNKDIHNVYTENAVNLTVEQLKNYELTLGNPLARIRFKSEEQDVQIAVNSGLDLSRVETAVELSRVGTVYDALYGRVVKAAKIRLHPQVLGDGRFGLDNRVLVDRQFLPAGDISIDADVSVNLCNEKDYVMVSTVHGLQTAANTDIVVEGIFLGYPIEFDITVNDWFVNTSTITFD